MSKSLSRVRLALLVSGLPDTIRATETPSKTAQLAAEAVGCEIDQIAKSILFLGQHSGGLWLFVTAGGRRVDAACAERLAGEPLGQADAGIIRSVTGFAIGGVAPIGHLSPPRGFFDLRLLDFSLVWAAAGTPQHVFSADPHLLAKVSGLSVESFSEP